MKMSCSFLLKNEWNFLKASNDFGLRLHENSGEFSSIQKTKGSSSKFKFDIDNERNIEYRKESGLLSLLHSWCASSSELVLVDACYLSDVVDETNIEKFRQLVMIWFLLNDMNGSNYLDFEGKK